MIICRKPWTIYDVDAVGAAGVVVFVLAAGHHSDRRENVSNAVPEIRS